MSRFTKWRLFDAAERGDIATVKQCLGSGVPVDSRDPWGGSLTPLHHASEKGKVEVVQLLLERGATVDALSKLKKTPLHFASEEGKVEVVQLLLEGGATVDAQDVYKNTPLHLASQNGKVEVVQLLLDRGATVDARDKDGWTPLHRASMRGKVEVAELLLNRGAAVNAIKNDGWTPLMLASFNNRKDTVILLLKHHADLNMQNKNGETGLILACQRGHKEVVVLLLEANADVNMKSKWGQTAMDVSSDEIKEIIKAHIAAGPTPKVSPPQPPPTPPTSSQQAPDRATQMTASDPSESILQNYPVSAEATPLYSEDLPLVVRTVSKLSDRWNNIRTLLKVFRSQEEIKRRFPGVTLRCLIIVLDDWLKRLYDREQDPEQPSWRKVVRFVADPSGGQDAALAEHIAQNHQNLREYPGSMATDTGALQIFTTNETIEAQAKDIARRLVAISSNWFEIGVLLGITVSRLEALRENDFQKCLDHIIKEWLNTTKPEHRTWQFLAAVIKDEAGGGNSALAKELTDYSHGLQAQERRDHHVDTNYPDIHFYGKPFEAAVSSEGKTVAFDDIGLTMSVPPGAVPEGTQLDLTVRPCVSGPFSLPEGYQPVSPAYLINASSQLTQEVKVSVEHFAELQREEDCKNLVFLRASSTCSGHQYKFEEIPQEKFTFTVGYRRGVVSLKCFSFFQAVMKAIWGENTYSLRLYWSPNPSPEEVTALFCVTLMHQLYIQSLETEVRNLFPEGHKMTVVEPVCLCEEKLTIDVPSQIKGWSVEPDRLTVVTRREMDLPQSNPDYTQFSSYPPKFHLRVLPIAEEHNQTRATSCYFSVTGLEEAAGFHLFLPRALAATAAGTPEDTSDTEQDDTYGGTDVPLGEEDFSFLLIQLKDTAAKWRKVGVYLGFRSGVLDIIERKPLLIPDGCSAFFRELLSQWLKWAPPDHPDPTVRNLVSALRRAGEERRAFKFEAAFERKAKAGVQAELNSQVTELKKKVESLEKEKTELDSKQRKMDSQDRELKKKVESLEKEKAELSSRQRKMDTQVKELKKKVEGLEKEKAELSSTKAGVQAELNSQVTELKKKVESLEEKAELSSRQRKMDSQDQELKEKVEGLEKEKAELSSTKAGVQAELNSQVTELKKKVESLEKEKTELDSRQRKMDSQVQELKEKVEGLEKEKAELISRRTAEETPSRSLNLPMHTNTESIQIAAEQLVKAAMTWEDNVMVSAVKKIASFMEEVVKLARQSATGAHPDNSKKMMTMVMEIVRESNAILQTGRKIASECTNKDLVKDVQDCVEKISTIRTQLEVGARAKATHLQKDSSEHAVAEAIQNLADNAENLQKSISDLLNVSETASIRVSPEVRGRMGLWWKRRKDDKQHLPG